MNCSVLCSPSVSNQLPVPYVLSHACRFGNVVTAPAAGSIHARLLSTVGSPPEEVNTVYDLLDETLICFKPTQAGMSGDAMLPVAVMFASSEDLLSTQLCACPSVYDTMCSGCCTLTANAHVPLACLCPTC